MEKEAKKIIFEIIYIAVITIVLSYLWWGPYRNDFRAKISLQEKYWNQTKDLATAGFETVQIEKNATAKEVSIENKSNGERSFTIAFMVDDGKENQNTNKNNYVKYYIMDQDGNCSDERNLSLNGNIYTSTLESGEKAVERCVLWSEEEQLNLDGNLSLIANPVL